MIKTIKDYKIEEVLSLWNTALPDHKLDKRLFVKNILLDVNYDPNGFFIAETDGHASALTYALIRRHPIDVGAPSTESRGYINAIGFKDNNIITTVGKELLSHAESYLRSQGVAEISVGKYSPNYFSPGINNNHFETVKLFSKMGYEEDGAHRSIRIDLTDFEANDDYIATKTLAEGAGFEFTALKDEYISDLLKYAPPGWVHRYRRLLSETMDYEKVRIVLKDDRIVGCAVFGDPYSAEERFGPFMVSEGYRGMGIGRILLTDTLLCMKSRGLTYAWAQSTPIQGAAAHLYEKVGFIL